MWVDSRDRTLSSTGSRGERGWLAGDRTSINLGDGEAKDSGGASFLGFLLEVWLPAPGLFSSASSEVPPLYGRIDTLEEAFPCPNPAAFFFGLRDIRGRAVYPDGGADTALETAPTA